MKKWQRIISKDFGSLSLKDFFLFFKILLKIAYHKICRMHNLTHCLNDGNHEALNVTMPKGYIPLNNVTFRKSHYNHECCTALVTLFVVLHFIIKMISCYRILFLSFGLISSHLTQARTAKSLKTSDCRSWEIFKGHLICENLYSSLTNETLPKAQWTHGIESFNLFECFMPINELQFIGQTSAWIGLAKGKDYF